MKNIAVDKEEWARRRAEGIKRFHEAVEKFKGEVKEHIFLFFMRVPERYRRNWLKCFYGTASSKRAIAAKCYECIGYEDSQTQIGQCTARTCPLWNYRPIKK